MSIKAPQVFEVTIEERRVVVMRRTIALRAIDSASAIDQCKTATRYAWETLARVDGIEMGAVYLASDVAKQA